MFPNPDQLSEVTPQAILEAAAQGHLGLDHRFLRSLLDRPAESVAALAEFAKRDRSLDAVDMEPDLVALFRELRAPEGIPFLIECFRAEPTEAPDDLIETLNAMGPASLEPLLAFHDELDEAGREDVLFALATLGMRDPRIFEALKERLEFDAMDGIFLLGLYGDAAAKPVLEELAANAEGESAEAIKREVAQTLALLDAPVPKTTGEAGGFNIWELYPERADLPMELLDEDERIALLDHPSTAVRAAAAHSFFNRELDGPIVKKLLAMATGDPEVSVRSKAWESLSDAGENPEVVEAMLKRMRDPETPLEERGGVLVGLAGEADRNEVRAAMEALYRTPGGRAKGLEAMWRSVHPSFKNYFTQHLGDEDLEVRRSAIWGVGYHRIKSELDRLRAFFDDEELRMDALFAYALTLPGETSRGRMRGMLAKIEEDAQGLSEMEENLVMAALDERLVMAGKEPYFAKG